MAYDGLAAAATRTRVGAFIHQARQRLEFTGAGVGKKGYGKTAFPLV